MSSASGTERVREDCPHCEGRGYLVFENTHETEVHDCVCTSQLELERIVMETGPSSMEDLD